MSFKKLNGIAHDIAHHAQSGLSYLHPYLANGCKTLGIAEITLDLLEDPYPSDFPVTKPLTLSTLALKEKFFKMISTLDTSPTELESAILIFHFPLGSDDYSSVVTSKFRLTSGKEISHVIDLPKNK